MTTPLETHLIPDLLPALTDIIEQRAAGPQGGLSDLLLPEPHKDDDGAPPPIQGICYTARWYRPMPEEHLDLIKSYCLQHDQPTVYLSLHEAPNDIGFKLLTGMATLPQLLTTPFDPLYLTKSQILHLKGVIKSLVDAPLSLSQLPSPDAILPYLTAHAPVLTIIDANTPLSAELTQSLNDLATTENRVIVININP